MERQEREQLLGVLQSRFEANSRRHPNLDWHAVAERLAAYPEKLRSLSEMEQTGGEPDVVGYDAASGAYIFHDCAPETPAGRRSICYDREGLESRKAHKPHDNAVDMAARMGIEILTEIQYRALQELGTFDARTSSWLQTPPAIRTHGGAIFGDFRYGHVFVYHNGAQSYYAGRGFRGSLHV